MMDLETMLLCVPVQQWQTRQALAFDWYDGPRSGACVLEVPGGEFWFEVVAERRNEEGLDDRLFKVSELPVGTIQGLLIALNRLGGPTGPLWAPLWRFPDDASRAQAEQRVETLVGSKQPTSLIISTPDMLHFQGCWQVDSAERNGMNWFDMLGLTRAAPQASA